jgi:hypothetical protein
MSQGCPIKGGSPRGFARVAPDPHTPKPTHVENGPQPPIRLVGARVGVRGGPDAHQANCAAGVGLGAGGLVTGSRLAPAG